VALLGGFVAAKAGSGQYQIKRLQSFVDPTADTQGAGYRSRTGKNYSWFWWVNRNRFIFKARKQTVASFQNNKQSLFLPLPVKKTGFLGKFIYCLNAFNNHDAWTI
jgi:hypothetical protein